MTSTTERTFIDTNVLVYAFSADDDRSPVARALLADLWETGAGVLSSQVLTEFYNVATHKLNPRMSPAQARKVVAEYSEWCDVLVDELVVVQGSFLAETHSVSFWDALIIEAAVESGARYLVSEDLQHGRRFANLEIRNPFASV